MKSAFVLLSFLVATLLSSSCNTDEQKERQEINRLLDKQLELFDAAHDALMNGDYKLARQLNQMAGEANDSLSRLLRK